MAAARQCSHCTKAVSPTFPPQKVSRLEVGESLGQDIARTADPS